MDDRIVLGLDIQNPVSDAKIRKDVQDRLRKHGGFDEETIQSSSASRVKTVHRERRDFETRVGKEYAPRAQAFWERFLDDCPTRSPTEFQERIEEICVGISTQERDLLKGMWKSCIVPDIVRPIDYYYLLICVPFLAKKMPA